MVCSISLFTLVNIKRQNEINTIFLHEDKPTYRKGVVTVIDGGRLCNKIFEYVSVWALSRSYGLVPYVPDSIHSVLKDVFTHLRIPPWSELHNSLDSCLNLNSTTLNTTIYDVSNLEKTLRNMNESEEPFILRQYMVLVDSIVPLVGELKKEYKYQPVYIHKAQDRLQHARAIMNDEHGNRETLFVAVHVRRADYVLYLKRRGVTVSVDVNYYRHAVDWMLRKLASESKTSHIAFILASDDKFWWQQYVLLRGKRNSRGGLGDALFLQPLHHILRHIRPLVSTYGQWLDGGLRYAIVQIHDNGLSSIVDRRIVDYGKLAQPLYRDFVVLERRGEYTKHAYDDVNDAFKQSLQSECRVALLTHWISLDPLANLGVQVPASLAGFYCEQISIEQQDPVFH
uniref:L-Fucosyltransferase n=1 Tax=Timema cristinae TaxID=61476 RepID=A0A7R9CKX6_TIMCR|nr:unnamed protein product [Timema cristinae]